MTSKKKRRQARRRWKGSSGLLLVGIISIAAIVAAIALMAFGGDGEGSERRPVRAPMVVSEEQHVTIEVVDSDYEPRNLTIRPGTEVTWEFTGSLPHTVTDPAGAFDSGTLGRGDTFKMTFDDPGQYSYYCVLHHVMQATLVVAAATPATQE
jgi:plastocyanin